MNLRLLLGLRSNKYLNDYFTNERPSAQNTVDIFKGEWSSYFPDPYQPLKVGQVPLFTDERVKWFANEVGVEGKSVLELGPLEGGHSYLLDRLGAKSITAIEANSHAFLRCLISKELLGMPSVRFHFGNFLEHLRAEDCPQYEICLASGVLYHMQNPVELIALLCKHCTGSIYFWTHYYDEKFIKLWKLTKHFPHSHEFTHEGFKHRLYRQEYKKILLATTFCGGTAPFSHWLSLEDIQGALKHFGFGKQKISFHEEGHPHGPSLAMMATRG